MKVGTLAKITDRLHGHEFPIGEVVRFTNFDGSSFVFEYLDEHDYWFLTEEEFEVLEKE